MSPKGAAATADTAFMDIPASGNSNLLPNGSCRNRVMFDASIRLTPPAKSRSNSLIPAKYKARTARPRRNMSGVLTALLDKSHNATRIMAMTTGLTPYRSQVA